MDKKTYLIKQLDYIRINSSFLSSGDMETQAEGILKNLENLEEYCPEENKSSIKCRGCGIPSEPIYLVKFKDDIRGLEGNYCVVCLTDLKRYSKTIISYKKIKI